MRLAVCVPLFYFSLMVCLAVPGNAVTRTWDDGDPNDSFWDSNANWSDDMQPNPGDDAIVGGDPIVNTLETIANLDNSGDIQITAGTLQVTGGTVNNDGIIDVGDGTAVLSQLLIDNLSTLSGSGEVVLQNSDNLAGSNSILRGASSAANPTTHGVNHTIRGEGSVIQNWVNNGLIRAEEASGDSSAILRLNNGTVVNGGTIASSSSASIEVSGFTITDNSGILLADTQPITFLGSTINGGTLTATGGGVFKLGDGNNALVLSGTTLNAPLENSNTLGNAAILVDSNGVTNNSTITLNGQSPGLAQFGFSATGTLGGTGEIILASGDSQSAIGIFPSISVPFTQAVSHTIRGAGHVNAPIINEGNIIAEPQAGGSTLQFNSPQTNNGLIEAASGAILRFPSTGDVNQGSTGIISAADGGTVQFVGVDISGGRLESSGSGEFNVIDSAVTRFTDATNAGSVNLLPFNFLHIQGSSFTNDGTVTLNSTGGNAFTSLQFNGNIALGGSGEVVLNEPSFGFPANVVPNGYIVTQDPNHTIRGKGQIIGAGKFVNNGRIEGDPNNLLRIRTRLEGTGTLKDVLITFDNTGTVHAPGNGVGTVPLEGIYEINHALAKLEIEIGGLTAGTEHDLLDGTSDPNSTIALAGILDVRAVDLGNSYVPDPNDRFTIIQSSNAITGTFNSVLFPSILGGRYVTWDPVDYSDPKKVVLEIATVDFFEADFDEDGDVDEADLTNWQGGYGNSSASHMDGDANGDGRVDALDFFVWQRQLGLGVSPLVAAVSAVPEPGTLSLLCLGCLLGIRRRR